MIRVGGVLLSALLPLGAALLARRTVRLGRSDRRGAFRLAACCSCGALAACTSLRWIASLWMVTIPGVFCLVLLEKGGGIDATYPLLDVAFTAVMMLIPVVVFFRFGLLALMVGVFVMRIAHQPFTLDPSKIYAGPSWMVMAMILALAIVGFSLARGGEPVFGAVADDAPAPG